MMLKKQRGSALLNLLIGIGIVAMLATVSIPNINNYKNNLKLNTAAKILATDLRYAQQLTITEQKVHIVQFDQTYNLYHIYKIDALATTTIKSVDLPDQIYFNEINGLSDNQIIFNYYGGVSEQGQVILTNSGVSTTTINIKPSGYVQIQ